MNTENTNPTGAELIAAERVRQINEEDWTADHDDQEHQFGELARAAASYALQHLQGAQVKTIVEEVWPWQKEWWKPCEDPVRNLVKAGALIAAEIDRLNREKSK